VTSLVGHVGITTSYKSAEIVIECSNTFKEIGIASKVLPAHLRRRTRWRSRNSRRRCSLGYRRWTSCVAKTPCRDAERTTTHFGRVALARSIAVGSILNSIVAVERVRAVTFAIVFGTGKDKAKSLAGSLAGGIGHGITPAWYLTSYCLREYSCAIVEILIATQSVPRFCGSSRCGCVGGSSCGSGGRQPGVYIMPV
jgi:hypothetical protein